MLFRIDLKFIINLKSIRWQGQSFGRSSWFNTAAWVLKNLPKVIYIAFLLSNGHTGLDCMICFRIIREPVVQLLKITYKYRPLLASKRRRTNELQLAWPILEYLLMINTSIPFSSILQNQTQQFSKSHSAV